MSDLISRKAIMKILDDAWVDGMEYQGWLHNDIEALPTIEAKPVKHGKWLKTAQSLVFPEKFRNYFCSECGFELDKSIKAAFRYCPYCGAQMSEVENG